MSPSADFLGRDNPLIDEEMFELAKRAGPTDRRDLLEALRTAALSVPLGEPEFQVARSGQPETAAGSAEVEDTLYLVARAQGGDDPCLDRLFARYYPRVREIVRRRLGKRLRVHLDSGDIVQSAFLRAAECIGRFEMRDESSFARWLSRLVENQITNAADYHFAQKRRPATSDADECDIAHIAASTRNDPLAGAAAREEARLIEECVAGLPENYRELVVMRNYLDYSWKEIAEETGRPSEDAARMMYAKALSKLSRAVNRRRADPDRKDPGEK